MVLADPIPPQVSQLRPLFYLRNKRPFPSFPVAFSFIGANRPRHFHRLDSLPLKHKSLPSLASQTLAQMSFFVIASLLSVGKDAIGQANIMSTQKMLHHLSQFPNGILRKVIPCLPVGVGVNPSIAQSVYKYRKRSCCNIPVIKFYCICPTHHLQIMNLVFLIKLLKIYIPKCTEINLMLLLCILLHQILKGLFSQVQSINLRLE